MGRRKKSAQTAELDRDLIEHILLLGLRTVEEYRQWCDRNGFSNRLGKSRKKLQRERSHARDAAAQERLRHKKRERRNMVEVISAICKGRVIESDLTEPHLIRLCHLLHDRKPQHERQINRQALLRLFAHLHQCRTKFFDGSPVIAMLGEWPGNTFVEALALVAAHAPSWLRPVENWKPRSHSGRRQFASLLRHLFARYDDMPLFFDTVWFAGRTREAAERRGWYLHVGRGQNIRHCQLPIPFTKKMAHHFMHAPADVTVEQALRWGQVHGLGGDERFVRALFGTRLGEDFEHNEFWETVIRWFISHPMLDLAHVGPIIDYLYHQRFVPEHVHWAPGHREESPPPQPHLSMKGRTPESLLRRVQTWHRTLSNDNTHQIRQWPPSGIEGFEFLEGSERGGNLKCWTIRELLSSKALTAEGRQMKHCVATYASSCARGHCSIWTMEIETFGGHTKAVTLEVRHGVRLICQARGKANRLPTEKERNIIHRWATAGGLKVASYV
jgi:hypothetical protein